MTSSTRRCGPSGARSLWDGWIPILAPEHLLVCKVLYDRPKVWLDAEQMLLCVDELDTEAVFSELDRTVGREDARVQRIRELVGRDRET